MYDGVIMTFLVSWVGWRFGRQVTEASSVVMIGYFDIMIQCTVDTLPFHVMGSVAHW